MKLRPTSKYLYYGLALVFSFVICSCEGLDDWSDLKSVDLFNTKKNESKQGAFKRYDAPIMSSLPLIESIYDPNSKFSKQYNADIRKVCDYTKLPFHSMTVTNWNSTLKISPSVRVIVVYDTKKLNDASVEVLINFVSTGGTLFIPFANEDKRMAFLLGFKPEAEYATDTGAKGWYFNTPILPGLKGKSFETNYLLYGFAGQNFSSKVKILATASNKPNYPTIIENPIGKGKVILYNTSGDFTKQDRGFLFAGVLKGLEGIPYPVANTATIFLDDFPAPQYDIIAEPVKTELNMTTSDFVQKVWWPDMKDLAKEFKIPYAAMLTFDYRNKIVPPFTLDQWNSKKIKFKDKVESLPDWLVNDVKKNGHELAFHGYNHVSLLKNLWKNPKFIETSMNTIKKKWEISNYGSLPVTYVPPSNDIDRMGIKELKAAMPSIKYICSLYIGQLEDGGDREFDYDPFEKNFFDYPRISSGFYIEDDEKYTIQSMYLYTGIWTHFVHPDDVFQIPSTAGKTAAGYSLRNQYSLGWKKSKNSDKAFFPEFKNFVRQFTTTYPQMRFVNGGKGGNIVMNWRASRYSHTPQNNGLYTVSEINPTDDSKKYWFMYGSPVNADRIENQLKSQMVLFSKTPFVDGYLYSVYSTKPKLTVVDLNYKTPKEKAQLLAINNLVKADFAKFNLDVKNFIKGGVWTEDYDKKLKTQMEALKNKLLSTPEIDPKAWAEYIEYMDSQNKNAEVWKMYEDHVKKYGSKNNIMYSKELDRLIGYMDDVEKEKWMSEQIRVSPNDKELLTSYYQTFDSEEYKDKIKNVLKALNQVDPSAQNYKNYIKHLIQYYPEEAIVELKDKKPTQDFADIATSIVWLFADNSDYKKAIEWSDFSTEIDFVTKMNWYIESGQSKELEPVYLKYIAEHPEDEIATVLMSNVYHEQGRFKDSWVLANSLSNIYEKEELRKILNRDVVYEDIDLQQDLIANHVALFYPDVLKKLTKDIRLAVGDFIDFKTYLETNQKNPAFQRNQISYNLYDKKGYLHSIGGNYSKYYDIDLTEKAYKDNIDNYVMGLEYKITTPLKENKPQYWSRARIEIDNVANPYYQFGVGLSRSKDKNFRSAAFNMFPVETAPGLNQGIYRLQTNLYQDQRFGKYINTSISIEGSYYTEGFLSRDTIGPDINPNRIALARKVYTELANGTIQVDDIDDSYEAALTLRLMLDKGDIKKSKFIPFIESQISQGSKELSIGYPYWMIRHRLYGGGGLGWEFTTPSFTSRVEAGAFLDDFSGHFERVNAELSYQLFDFTALTLNLEVFEQSKFYSNSIQFGIKHNFKKKYKKKK
ncbi:DUF2194 domain-containing protein [Flavobacterium sp.]|uniref:DUF2194 domain-containing protein n=1 Tax=Flavobacterium sp. TaxID=239 RepID=UPI00286AA7A2|nr:DUF2194 domain-containing protein [Flavobacterium sp.]